MTLYSDQMFKIEEIREATRQARNLAVGVIGRGLNLDAPLLVKEGAELFERIIFIKNHLENLEDLIKEGASCDDQT